VKEPNLVRKNGFLMAKQTFQLPAHTTHIRLSLKAEFTGQIEIASLTLTRKE
jgi:hypothetical protein